MPCGYAIPWLDLDGSVLRPCRLRNDLSFNWFMTLTVSLVL